MEHSAPGVPKKIGVPQGSVFGLLLLSIFDNDIFIWRLILMSVTM